MKAKLEIKVAQTAGFCFGVHRAVNLAKEAPEKFPGQQIHTLGPIIHNPQVVIQLAALGVRQADSLDQISQGVVIIRSHGITRQLARKLEQRPDLTVIDATCPFVRRAQEIVAKMSAADYQVVIIGEPDHPEVAGLISYGEPQRTQVISRKADIPAAFFTKGKTPRIALLAQTTQSQKLYNRISLALLPLKGELRCFNTICTATSDRQSEALELAGSCDCMLIIGGRNSANTNRLHELCKEKQNASYHIETAADIQNRWFADKQTVGISAGASTPKWLIDEVLAQLQQLC
ncbi:MAG: 4-hydroxy-3-methylbut-2-enyl diphosphate reductase [Deltaproteobacteria bacterium]|nr:4-hydroxy-3-methylbut-2-enyl diphosphate reductase [Deltaproteobacteria bacterium]